MAIVRNVQDAAILNTGARANVDAVHVAAENGRWPDTGIIADPDRPMTTAEASMYTR
jgi:hypothetical protein